MEERNETELGLKDYLGIIKRRAGLFALIAAPILTIAVALAFRLPPVYESIGILLVEQSEVSQDMVRSTITNLPDERVRRITERVLTSENLARIIAEHDPYPELEEREAVRQLRRSVVTGAEDPALVPSLIAGSTNVLAFRVGYMHPTAEKAHAVADELVSLYLSENQRARQEMASDTLAFLESQARRLEEQIAERETLLAAFKRDNAGRLPELSGMNMQLLDRTERDLEAAESEIRMLRERISSIESELTHLTPYAVVMDQAGNALLSSADRLRVLQREYVQYSARYSQDHPDIIRLTREIESLSAQTGLPGFDRSILTTVLSARRQELQAARERGFTDEHPDIVRLEMAVANLEQALANAPQTASRSPSAAPPDNPVYIQRQVQLQGARTELDAALTRRDELRRRLSGLEERLTQTPEVEREYQSLSRGHEQLVAQYGDVLRKQQEATIAVNLESENRGDRFSVVSSPDQPTRPAQPNRIAILLLGLAFAFMGGAGGVALAETMDSTVRSPRDVLALLEIPPLVMVPYIDNEADIRQRRWKRVAVAASVTAWVGIMTFLVMTPAGT
jgi:polysaccharide biosynthesis transport protein